MNSLRQLLTKTYRTMVFVIVGSFSMACLSQAVPLRAERPDIKVGQSWKYQTVDNRTKVLESKAEFLVTSVTEQQIDGMALDGKFTMSPSLESIDSATGSQKTKTSFLSFPLEVGKKWTHKVDWVNKATNSNGAQSFDIAVVGVEKVTTPAGELEAFRIESKGYSNNYASRGQGSDKRVAWYAPSAKAIVKIERNDGYSNFTRELMEFKLQP